ncbi:TNT domain-containing protein [Amycolatopsis nigrescens]|uniref:TNT domain-containing protein n=1 Tax=Amycolatopsis nigrescens TaxID=381445 RepID=UPI0003661AE8|nr:TNT domain-containing protein [Amycolatopsis nigrescens]
MAQPTTQLNATEQDTLVKQIGLALLRAAPRDWRRVTAEYRAVGRYHEMTGEIITGDGTSHEWVATHDIATLFGRLRGGMYRDGRGTWFNARYQLDHPSSYNLEYDREEPQWDLMPPPQAYADELRMFPRAEENVPEWLMRRMSGLTPEQPGPRFRVARIFDGAGPSGHPVINRPDLEVEEQDRLLEYLDTAPVVLSERTYDVDRLATTPANTVPVAFHTDGVWIWPAAVNFYLREYGVSPEAELVEHVRASRFVVPEVPEQAMQAAGAHLTRGNPPPRAAPAPPPPPPPPPPAPEPVAAPVGEETRYTEPEPAYDQFEPAYEEHFDQHAYETPEEAAEEQPEEQPPAYEEAVDETPVSVFEPGPSIDPGPMTMVAAPVTNGTPAKRPAAGPDSEDTGPQTRLVNPVTVPATPAAAPPAPSPEQPAPVLDELQQKLDELGVPDDHYRIGEPAEYGWSVEEVESGWRVGWYDGELTNPAVFGDAEDAAAFMLGKLLLVPDGRAPSEPAPAPAPAPAQAAAPVEAPPEPPPAPAPVKKQRPVLATVSPDIATGARPVPDRSEAEPTQLAMSPVAEPAAPPEPAPRPAAAAPRPPVAEPPPPAPGSLAERLEESGAPRGGGASALPPPAPPRREPPPAPPRREEPARPAAAAAPSDQRAPGGQPWPIQPFPGEPPLTLFRGKEMRELPVGSELDRFGGPNGNLTYAAGTPFEERSLVPEWVSRPYHVYRVQRPLETLAGVAIPWFNQPGGGAAYLLPASIEELVAEGDLIELDPGEPPVD